MFVSGAYITNARVSVINSETGEVHVLYTDTIHTGSSPDLVIYNCGVNTVVSCFRAVLKGTF